MSGLLQYAIDVVEGITATVAGGTYNIISHTPVNPLLLDKTALELLEAHAGTTLSAVVNDAGETVGYVAKGIANGGNGASSEVSTYVNVLTREAVVDAEMASETYIDMATGEVASLTVGETVTEVSAAGTGAGTAALGVEVAGAAIAVSLGILGGFALYNIAPSFWDAVAEDLMSAGELIGGKVEALFDSNGSTSFSEGAIEIYKEHFLRAGYCNDRFQPVTHVDDDVTISGTNFGGTLTKEQYNEWAPNVQHSPFMQIVRGDNTVSAVKPYIYSREPDPIAENVQSLFTASLLRRSGTYNHVQMTNFPNITGSGTLHGKGVDPGTGEQISGFGLSDFANDRTTYGVKSEIMYNFSQTYNPSLGNYTPVDASALLADRMLAAYLLLGSIAASTTMQDGATAPTADPFPNTYPNWHPSTNVQGKNYYPSSMPKDDGTQQQSQSGENDEDEKDIVAGTLFNPDPIPKPTIKPDPDPQPQPEPQPEPTDPTPVNDPTDPNPGPTPSDPAPTIPVIAGINASKMVTIYNPTDGEVNSLGAFLWVSNIIEQIKLIFQDPMDGIISLHKIYAQPVTGSRKDIVLGYIDSGVDALEVTSQFTTVSCGSVSISEKRHNATDYPPYTQAHIYLPFIGIEELDVAEIMGGTVSVQYRVDAYTGTCVAQIFVTRSADMSSAQMLYTFSGNASQSIPLTSGNFTGLMSSLVSIAGGAALGGVGGAVLAGAASGLTSHAASVSHSGNISANAGIMGPRKPFLILTRQQGYDANGYAGLYGYPANKTVYLSNCSGYVKVKDVLYRGDGTENEKQEIVELLKAGVIV